MSGRDIPIFCYWNGSIKEESNGLCYNGPPSRAIKIKHKTKFNKLLDEMYCITGFDRQQARLNLVCRYPTIVQSSMIKYIRLTVMDDGSVDIMLEIPSIHPSISNVELYLEVESVPIEPVKQESQSMGFVPVTQLPTQDHDILPNHANNSFSPGSEHIRGRQFSINSNILELSNCRTNSQYDRDTSINLTAVKQLVYFEPDDIFNDTNVNNRLLEEENEEHEEKEDFEEVNLETNHATLEVPLHDPNMTFFTNIDLVNDAATS
ncbi:hypothetical protein PTKIN_Ptkin05aG0100700 [Pterospermum kingtungense]